MITKQLQTVNKDICPKAFFVINHDTKMQIFKPKLGRVQSSTENYIENLFKNVLFMNFNATSARLLFKQLFIVYTLNH